MRIPVILLILVTGAVVIAGCMSVPQPCITGSGTRIIETREPGMFETVILTMPATLIVRNGNTPAVEIDADDNILPYIRTDISSGNLLISSNRTCIRPPGTISVTVTAPVIREIAITGTGTVASDGTLRAERLASRITGAGTMDLAVEAATLSTTITGTGNITLKGEADDHHISLPGAGSVDASGLQTERTTVEIFGSGDTRVDVNKTLTVRITGRGTVLYQGNPAIDQTITGTGSVRPIS